MGRLKSWAVQLKRDVLTLWIAARSTETPWAARLMAAAVAAYALSPIDLIPDFIPVLGYLDDLLIVPLGIYLTLQLIPAPLLSIFRAQAEAWAERPKSLIGAGVIVVIWLLALVWAVLWWPPLSAAPPGNLILTTSIGNCGNRQAPQRRLSIIVMWACRSGAPFAVLP